MQRELSLEADKTVVEGLVGAFAGMLEEARAQARAAVEAPADAVHDYRRALRRAEAVLSLAAPFLRKAQRKVLAAGVRRARRRTRVLRDLDAVAPILLEVRALEVLPEGDLALEGLAVWLEQWRAELASEELVAWRLRKNARALAGLGEILHVGLHAWADAEVLLESAREGYREAKRAWKVARASRTPEDVHALRRAARTLRYELELLASRPTLPAHAAIAEAHRTFKRLVKTLGEVTDLMALKDIAAEAREDVVGLDLGALERALDDLIAARVEVALGEAQAAFLPKAKELFVGATVAEAPEGAIAGLPEEDAGTSALVAAGQTPVAVADEVQGEVAEGADAAT